MGIHPAMNISLNNLVEAVSPGKAGQNLAVLIFAYMSSNPTGPVGFSSLLVHLTSSSSTWPHSLYPNQYRIALPTFSLSESRAQLVLEYPCKCKDTIIFIAAVST